MEEKLLEGFPVIVEFPVAWGDMDAMRHVNNYIRQATRRLRRVMDESRLRGAL